MFCFVRGINKIFGFLVFDAVAFDSLSQLRDELKRLMAHFKLA